MQSKPHIKASIPHTKRNLRRKANHNQPASAHRKAITNQPHLSGVATPRIRNNLGNPEHSKRGIA